jgi:hypothetical protein
VERCPSGADLELLPWADLPAVALRRAEDGSRPEQATEVRAGWCDDRLFLRFACRDRCAWGTYRERDDPLYEEEAVEVFLARGGEVPVIYAELEVSPQGVLFDAWVSNPRGSRDGMEVDPAWDCPGLRWQVGTWGGDEDWWAVLEVPLAALPGAPASRLRANFYRIDRPPPGAPGAVEHSAWSPTWARPADFHLPRSFGELVLVPGATLPSSR